MLKLFRNRLVISRFPEIARITIESGLENWTPRRMSDIINCTNKLNAQ